VLDGAESPAIRAADEVALVPKPRKHLVTYHGVLAPAAGMRSRVVPRRVEEEGDGEGCNHGTAGAAAAVPGPVAANGEDAAFRRRQLQRRLRERLRVPQGGGKRRSGRRRYPWADLLMRVLRIWLVGRTDTVIGAYWPIKGEFDPLPALHRWKEDGELVDGPQLRRIGLPVVDKVHKTLSFHAWYPGCPMEEDAYGIPKPKDTELIVPTLLFVPCVGYGAGGYRLGYGGGFYDRTLAALVPNPTTVGLGYTQGFVPDLEPEAHDIPLDAILNDNGVVWPAGG
jgi:5,10-methenyltetrahydrofolate synthetase